MRYLFLTSLVAISAIAIAEPSIDDAGWLRSPVFSGVPIINIAHKEKAQRPDLSGPTNVHTYFRREFSVDKPIARATAAVTADDYCKLYVNGDFAVQGPEPGYPSAYPYYLVDLTAYLRQGANCVASHVYYQGLCNRVWNSADNRSGFAMAIEIEYADGTSQKIVTDDSWRCFDAKTFSGTRKFGYSTQFAEDIDLRAEPAGWRDAGFDDSQWQAPLIERQDHQFIQSITPPLQVYSVKPVSAISKGDGDYFYDFGREIVGCTRIAIQGPAGHQIEIRHGEELDGENTVRYKMRAGCEYQEFATLTGGDDVVELYDYKGFRYVEILNAPAEPKMWVDVRHYPFDETASRLTSSDQLLADTWRICKAGVQMGSQGVFIDCPTREKGPYLGDALITSHGQLLLTADPRLAAKALDDFRRSQSICPGIMAVAPGSFMQEIAEYSLQYPLILRNYFMLTGDAEFTQATARAVFPPLFKYFAQYETDGGLIAGMTEKWVLVDWPDSLRDDYDYDYSKERENTVLNAFYYASLTAAADLLRGFGEDVSAYEEKAARIKQAFAEKLLDPATGLFLDAPGSKHSSLHANAVPLRFGLVAPENIGKVIDLIRAKQLSCGVYIAPFVIEACYEAGAPDLGYSLLTSRDKHSWYEMLRNGATTCMEAWGPDQKKNTSWCHPWSSSPVYLIIERVMGLTPSKPGWQRIRVAPRLPDGLDRLAVTFPIPAGAITARYNKDNGLTLTVPPDIEVDKENAAMPVTVAHSRSHGLPDPLDDARCEYLNSAGWQQRVGDAAGVWISVKEQKLRLIKRGKVLWEATCSTAANGVGAEMNSNKTPEGWHVVKEAIGDNAQWGQVFRSKKMTEEIWHPGQEVKEDLVLTRVLVLDGLEPGKNKGGNVDSYARCIYIHGTNDEERIGTPTSHGCIRLTNDDAITAFEKIPTGTPVLIGN